MTKMSSALTSRSFISTAGLMGHGLISGGVPCRPSRTGMSTVPTPIDGHLRDGRRFDLLVAHPDAGTALEQRRPDSGVAVLGATGLGDRDRGLSPVSPARSRWALNPCWRRSRLLGGCRVSGSTVEVTRSGAVRRAIPDRPSVPSEPSVGSTSCPATSASSRRRPPQVRAASRSTAFTSGSRETSRRR